MLARLPQWVRSTALMVAPNAEVTKNRTNISAPAAGFHFTQAERARASSESSRIQTHEPKKIPEAMRALSVIQLQPSR